MTNNFLKSGGEVPADADALVTDIRMTQLRRTDIRVKTVTTIKKVYLGEPLDD